MRTRQATASSTEAYCDRLKAHLAEYKCNPVWGLGIQAEGECRHRAYPHILPAREYRRNILDTIAEEFWLYWRDEQNRQPADGKAPRLHACFPHLNSSQALAFNLFFPFIRAGLRESAFLMRLLGSPSVGHDPVSKILLEFEPDRKEGSNFDVAIFRESGYKLLVEVKLTEDEFGTCANDQKHREKLSDTYADKLRDKVHLKFLDQQTFFQNYQILRHFAQFTTEHLDVVFLFPRANKCLAEGEKTIGEALMPSFVHRARMIYLEDFVGQVLQESEERSLLRTHFELFARKYLLETVPVPSQTV